MSARIWHPGLDTIAEVPEGAVGAYRQSGWLLASERDEHLERLAAHPSQAGEDQAGDDSGSKKRTRRSSSGGSDDAGGSSGDPDSSSTPEGS